jgi:16S rRNA (guanine527-N7)-methyltransferase
MRPEIAVTLAESQNKKAAFLREAIRTLGLNTKVHSARAEQLHEKFDCVTLRAVDNMAAAVPAAIQLIAQNGWLAVLTTRSETGEIEKIASNAAEFHWPTPIPLQPGTEHVLQMARRQK